MTSYETLRKSVDALGVVHGTLSDRLDDMLDNARINADDTVYHERAATDWNAIATASLESICADTHDHEAAAWFAAHGLRF
jgi:hypothetical protein